MSDLSIGEAIELLKPVLRGGITRTRVYVRSADDITLQNAFDVWHASTEWKPPVADGASKRFKGVTWKGSKHAEYWAHFEQCAYVVDGNPQVSCLLCSNLLQHPAVNGNKSMKHHANSSAHLNAVARLRSSSKDSDASISRLLAMQGKAGIEVGLPGSSSIKANLE
jgi:hypothetical protein